jgi:hypothetical protein
MRHFRRFVFIGVVLIAPGFVFAQPPTIDLATLVSQTLAASGQVMSSLSLSVAALKELPNQTLAEIRVVGKKGEIQRVLKGYVGVRLTDVLDKAGLTSLDHDDLKRTFIVAIASDGYKALFSWNELYNSPLGEGVIVLFERQGQALGDEEGRIAMISTKDLHTGARHVR